MSALDRCEAYVPREVDHATLQTYERNGASGSLISKMISSLQESPAVRDAKLKEHLERTQAKAQLRLLQTSLPILDYGEGLKKSRNHAFYVEKQKVRGLALAPLVVPTAVGCQKYAHLPPRLLPAGAAFLSPTLIIKMTCLPLSTRASLCRAIAASGYSARRQLWVHSQGVHKLS